jgi:hypothetical protein
VDWSKDNCNRQNKKSAPEDIKEAPKYNKGGYNHPVGEVGPASEETLHTCQSNINKEASASFRHTTHLLILRDKFRNCKRRRESGASLGEDILFEFELSLGIVLAIYNKEVLLGFLPLEGFPG